MKDIFSDCGGLGNVDSYVYDCIEQLKFVYTDSFLEKWKYMYSTKFITHFRYKLLDSLSKSKVLTITSLTSYLVKQCRYSEEQVNNFYQSIEIDLYYPFIQNARPRKKRQ